jgi:hypothetical protein
MVENIAVIESYGDRVEFFRFGIEKAFRPFSRDLIFDREIVKGDRFTLVMMAEV